jgi:hypothetical protein
MKASTYLGAVLALTIAACSGNATETESGRIGEAVSSIDALELHFNLDDGLETNATETYKVLITSGLIQYKHSDGTTRSSFASAEQLDQFVAAVLGTNWRTQTDCLSFRMDRGAYPPRLVVRSGASQAYYTVSDASCAISDHSALDNVISCAAYTSIHSQLLEIMPGGQAPFCASYW